MAEWLYEDGIGENRAILIDGGEIVEAVVELPSPVRTGAVLPARLTSILASGRRGIAMLKNGEEALIEPLPKSLTEGATFRAEILREAIPEAGRAKRAIARATDTDLRSGPTLAERLGISPEAMHGADGFEAAGWSELLDQAATGEIPFPGGALRMTLTPALTLFDVDGQLPPADLAEAGARAAAQAIRRFGIGGSIGIDLPTVPAKAGRQRAVAAVDALLPQPFERTAVNGFGFLQIVRRRERPSIPEIVQGDPIAAAARALVGRASRLVGAPTLQAAPAVIGYIQGRPHWVSALARRCGGAVALRADHALAISAGHAHISQS